MKKFTSFFLVVFIALTLVISWSCEDDPWQLPDGLRVGMDTLGGTIIFLDETKEHGLVAARVNQANAVTWDEADEICKNLTLKNYNGWRLPTNEESLIMYNKRTDISCYDPIWIWTSTENATKDSAIIRNFAVDTNKVLLVHKDSFQFTGNDEATTYPFFVRAVREF